MSLEQLIALRAKQQELQAKWLGQLLAIASGGFALLAGLGPAVPTGMGKYFLAGAWVLLGAGICSGAAATYLEVDRARRLADQFQSRLRQSLETQGRIAMTEPVIALPGTVFSWSVSVMVVSLLLAVACLVAYAVLQALGG